MKDKLLAGTFSYDDYQTVLVKVDWGGEIGWGEAMTRFSPQATAHLVRWIGDRLSGLEFKTPVEAWSKVWRLLRVRGQTRGVAVEALSGVEIALWDALGKARKKPVGRLLAKKTSGHVPAYAGSVFQSRGPIEDQIERVRGLEMRGFKLKVGFGVAEDLFLVKRARKLWDDCLLVPDANGAYDVAAAKRLAKGISEFHPEWLEEPVPSDDFQGYRELTKGGRVPIGAGEAWFPGDLEEMIRSAALDVLETSVSRCGGIGVQFGTASAAIRKGLAFSPMVGVNSSVSLAASLQVASACPSLGLEYDAFENPLVKDLTPGFPCMRSGELAVPMGAGLGIEVDEGFIRGHLVQG